MTIPRNNEYTPRLSNYGYAPAEPTIPQLDRVDPLRPNVSPQMLHFQQIEERMVDQLNELYKATMMMHANQHETRQRPEPDQVDRSNPPYVQHEPIYNPGVCPAPTYPNYLYPNLYVLPR